MDTDRPLCNEEDQTPREDIENTPRHELTLEERLEIEISKSINFYRQ